MMLRNWRKILGATAAVLGVTLPIVTVATTHVQALNGVSDCAPPGGPPIATTALDSLCVESSTDGSSTDPFDTGIQRGDRIVEFKWLVNEDDSTGDPSFTSENIANCLPTRAKPTAEEIATNPVLAQYEVAGDGDLELCPWPSVHASPGHSGVVASGNHLDVGNLVNLPDGKYLISVTASGFKIDGIHFEVVGGVLASVNDEAGKPFIVRMNPLPKKTLTIRVHVFNDNASTNGQWDGQTETLLTCDLATPAQLAANCGGVPDPLLVADPETDMSGFSVALSDVVDTTTTDVFGNPLCTQYETDGLGNIMLNEDGSPNPLFFADGGATGGAFAGTESTCLSDHYGDIVIPNMGPNRYAVTVNPPDPRIHGDDVWIRTTSLEGGHDWDSWNIEGDLGFDTEFVVGGERTPPVIAGFVKLTNDDVEWDLAEAAAVSNPALEAAYYDASGGFTGGPAGTGVLEGTLNIGRAYTGSGGGGVLGTPGAPFDGHNLANAKADGPISDGIVAISCIAVCNAPTDTLVWAGRAREDGTFSVSGLQTGDYVVSFWDEQQSYILVPAQYSVTTGATTDVGDVLLPGWFTDLTGYVFNDLDGDGFRDPGEPGVPDFGLSVRTRGNSVQDQGANLATTNHEGFYDLSQAYPLGQFLILEAYNPRFKSTGYTYTTDNDPVAHTIVSGQVDVAFLPALGLSATIDWGIQAFGTGTDYWSGDGVTPAPENENGGIVGTVIYDVTRNEFDPAKSAQEDYQPGVPGLPVQLWKTQRDGNGDLITTATGAIQQYGLSKTDGSLCARPDTSRGTNAVTDLAQDCKPFDYTVTESWGRPTGCVALDINGVRLEGELALPDPPAPADYDESHSSPDNPGCVEAPMSGIQIGGEGSVDGNYGLTSAMRGLSLVGAPASGPDLEEFYGEAAGNPAISDPMPNGDYVVEVVNPVDEVNPKPISDPNAGGYIAPTTQNRLYRFTDETSLNVFTGDVYAPQYGFSGPPAGGDPGAPLVADPTSPIRIDRNSLGTGPYALCAGSLHEVAEIGSPELEGINPDLYAGGGNPYSGRMTPVCDSKLVTVAGGRSMPAGFFMYTEVPIPTKFFGYISDDLNIQTDRRSTFLGEVAPVPNAPIGVYDENGNWKYTAHSDFNGFYEVLLPSTGTYNCPLPAGPCANVFRLVGNDPGTLFHRNEDYNPQFRTIATQFQGWPGVIHPVDQAPTHNGVTIEGPAAQFGVLSLCALAPENPVLFTIDKPYYNPNVGGDVGHVYTIEGSGFGNTGTLRMGATPITTLTWSDTQITFDGSAVPVLAGPYQLSITNGQSGLSTVNGLTFHRLSPGSTGASTYLQLRDVYTVSPAAATDSPGPATRTFSPMHDAWDAATNTAAGFSGVDINNVAVTGGRAIQRAVETARAVNNRPKLVVIYPNTASNYAPHNAFGAYFENVVLHSRVKLQGVGPGGVRSNTDFVLGTNIDASLFWAATQVVPPGGNQMTADGSYSEDWRIFANALPRTGEGPDQLPEGSGVLAIAETDNQYGNPGGPLGAFPAFRAGVDGMLLNHGIQEGDTGTTAVPVGGAFIAPGPAQGGAITLDQNVRDFHITNNRIESNGGSFGTIRIGTPNLTGTAADNDNDRLNVANNRIVANGGTNLAGALAIYTGTTRYTVTGNDFCGNFSAEYGGAISHYGLSDLGSITKNRIYYNQGYDEGGGIMIAGALPANNAALSPGAGRVTIDSNLILSNQSNDDGGGLRFLMAGTFAETVTNNIIANNMSAHEGAGVALDDSTNVRLINNTVVKNITTGTAGTNATLPLSDVRRANPAGLSTGGNSALLQASLPNNSPNWSRPRLLNNIFADNRAGWAELPTNTNFNDSAIHGIGDPNDVGIDIQRWDIGVPSAAGLCNSYNNVTFTCNSAAFSFLGANNTTNALASAALTNADPAAVSFLGAGANNIAPTLDGADTILFVNAQDFLVDSLMWRGNPTVAFPVLVAHYVPITLLADYHLTSGSPLTLAIDGGAASGVGVSAPALDIDGEARPLGAGYERGADERGPLAPLVAPIMSVLDDFNRANDTTLGSSWDQPTVTVGPVTFATITVVSSAAEVTMAGQALWNGPSPTFGATQGAKFTVANTPDFTAALMLKATGADPDYPDSFIHVQYQFPTSSIVVRTTTNGGSTYTTVSTFTGISMTTGDSLTAVANADGSVDVWMNATYLGHSATTAFTGTGRIGIQLGSLTGTRVDNFEGGTVL